MNAVQKGLGKILGYARVGGGWGDRGIVGSYSSKDDRRAENQKLLFGQDEGSLFFHIDVLF